MKFLYSAVARRSSVIDLFRSSFTDSDGAEEGNLVGDLVRDLLDQTPPNDIRVFLVEDGDALIAGAVFTRLEYARDPRTVFILSPMAVATDRQRQGLGCLLLKNALSRLRDEGVHMAVTYGDPAFYTKVGFAQINVAMIPAPFPLSQPEGWVVQALKGGDMSRFSKPCSCVAALNNPAYW